VIDEREKCPECGFDDPVHSLSCGRRFLPLAEDHEFSASYLSDLNDGHGNWDIEPPAWDPRNLNAGY